MSLYMCGMSLRAKPLEAGSVCMLTMLTETHLDRPVSVSLTFPILWMMMHASKQFQSMEIW